MRVLLYIEPHPIRNSKIHFDDVARKFLPLLKSVPQDFDARMYVTDAVIDKLGVDAVSSVRQRLIRSTKQEEAMITDYLCDWDQEGISVWLDLMAGRGEVSKNYHEVLRRIWSVFPFDVLVYWGENGAIRTFAEDRPITKIGMELGCTRPPFFDSLVMDPFGTNGAAVVPRLSVKDLRDIVDGQCMSSHEAMLAYSQNLETKPYVEQFQPLPLEVNERLLRSQKVVFLPLQLYDDANLLRFSPYKTITDVVLDVVPRLAENGYTILIKPHPAAKHRGNAAFANNMARTFLRQWSDSIIWCDYPENVTNTQLIRIADFVVTVNSSVGFEALYFDKPVVVLGDAIYKPKDLFPTLDQILDGNFERSVYLQGIGYLRKFFLEGYLQPLANRSDPSSFFGRISLIHTLQQNFDNEPVDFAKKYWRASSLTNSFLRRSAMFAGKSTPGQNEFGAPKTALATVQPFNTSIRNDIDIFLPYIGVARKLINYSGFSDIFDFSSWLSAKSESVQGAEELVKRSEILDVDYYLATYPDLLGARIDPLKHYAKFGIKEGRSPRHGLPHHVQLNETIENIVGAATLLLNGVGLSEYSLDSELDRSRQTQLQAIRAHLKTSSSKVAVVAHLFYCDLVPGILSRLSEISEPFDLIVTLPNWGAARIVDMVKSKYPRAVFYMAANRGRDIGPFMDVLPLLLERNYDCLLKVQTKRGYFHAGKMLPEMGELWREEMLDALLGDANRVKSIIRAFRDDKSINMVGPSPYFLALEKYPYHDGGLLASMLLDKNSVDGFFAGTMFWVRPSCLSNIAKVVRLTHFAAETGANDGALAHLVERMFGQAAGNAGGRVVGVSPDLNMNLDATGVLSFQDQPIFDYLIGQLKKADSKEMALMW